MHSSNKRSVSNTLRLSLHTCPETLPLFSTASGFRSLGGPPIASGSSGSTGFQERLENSFSPSLISILDSWLHPIISSFVRMPGSKHESPSEQQLHYTLHLVANKVMPSSSKAFLSDSCRRRYVIQSARYRVCSSMAGLGNFSGAVGSSKDL